MERCPNGPFIALRIASLQRNVSMRIIKGADYWSHDQWNLRVQSSNAVPILNSIHPWPKSKIAVVYEEMPKFIYCRRLVEIFPNRTWRIYIAIFERTVWYSFLLIFGVIGILYKRVISHLLFHSDHIDRLFKRACKNNCHKLFCWNDDFNFNLRFGGFHKISFC